MNKNIRGVSSLGRVGQFFRSLWMSVKVSGIILCDLSSSHALEGHGLRVRVVLFHVTCSVVMSRILELSGHALELSDTATHKG